MLRVFPCGFAVKRIINLPSFGEPPFDWINSCQKHIQLISQLTEGFVLTQRASRHMNTLWLLCLAKALKNMRACADSPFTGSLRENSENQRFWQELTCHLFPLTSVRFPTDPGRNNSFQILILSLLICSFYLRLLREKKHKRDQSSLMVPFTRQTSCECELVFYIKCA